MNLFMKIESWLNELPSWLLPLATGTSIVLMVIAVAAATLSYSDASHWEGEYWKERKLKEAKVSELTACQQKYGTGTGWVRAAQLTRVKIEAAKWKGMVSAKNTAYSALLTAMREAVKSKCQLPDSGTLPDTGSSRPDTSPPPPEPPAKDDTKDEAKPPEPPAKAEAPPKTETW